MLQFVRQQNINTRWPVCFAGQQRNYNAQQMCDRKVCVEEEWRLHHIGYGKNCHCRWTGNPTNRLNFPIDVFEIGLH